MGTYIAKLSYQVGKGKWPDIELIESSNPQNARIGLSRNMVVDSALKNGFTHVFFLDPDHDIDRYCRLGDERAVPFFDAAWSFMRQHDGPCICAAPYCGRGPEYPVHVFVRNDAGRVVRIKREQTANLHGWFAVEGAGTGVMLIDTRVFGLLERSCAEERSLDWRSPPWFSDAWQDAYETRLLQSQDVHFCLKCRRAGVPIYVNFDCWAGHYQTECIERPGWQPPVAPPAPQLIVEGQGDECWK